MKTPLHRNVYGIIDLSWPPTYKPALHVSDRMPVAVGSARSVYNKARRQMPDNGMEDDVLLP